MSLHPNIWALLMALRHILLIQLWLLQLTHFGSGGTKQNGLASVDRPPSVKSYPHLDLMLVRIFQDYFLAILQIIFRSL